MLKTIAENIPKLKEAEPPKEDVKKLKKKNNIQYYTIHLLNIILKQPKIQKPLYKYYYFSKHKQQYFHF